jgi:hypothetical protein
MVEISLVATRNQIRVGLNEIRVGEARNEIRVGGACGPPPPFTAPLRCALTSGATPRVRACAVRTRDQSSPSPPIELLGLAVHSAPSRQIELLAFAVHTQHRCRGSTERAFAVHHHRRGKIELSGVRGVGTMIRW